MDLYADNILDHYRHPRSVGRLATPTITEQEANPSCGDAITLDLVIDTGIIADLAWQGTGCAISQAGMSMLAEIVRGMPVADALAIDAQRMKELLGVPIGLRRLDCALLGLRTLQKALAGIQRNQ